MANKESTINLQSLRVALRSRLHARMIQYDLFLFGNDMAGVNVHTASTNVKVTIPFIVEVTDDDQVNVHHDDDVYTVDTTDVAVGIIAKLVRTAEQKTKKFNTK